MKGDRNREEERAVELISPTFGKKLTLKILF
jgi:hypothetical protein